MDPIRAAALLDGFAERTGLTSDRPARRYLWTDAFAVCTWLGLARTAADGRFATLARALVGQVHAILGSQRSDAVARGPLSGLDPAEAARHPTRGGLRIGKALPERAAAESYDERREWDRDGQYFHYLTRWMHALDQATRATGDPTCNAWARELAHAAHAAFVHTAPDGRRRLYWKMSIDLRRPLVASMGQHDALDGFVTCLQLASTATRWPGPAPAGPPVEPLAADFASMIDPRGLATADPLGLGGLLADAYRIDQLVREGASVDDEVRDLLLASAHAGLDHYASAGDLHQPAEHRLAFRELGLAIGLAAIARMTATVPDRDARGCRLVEALARHRVLGTQITTFWMDPRHRRAASWSDHLDINEVMLATALAPDGYLVLGSPP